MKKVLFLDRDGVIIQETGGYTYLPEQVKMVQGIESFLKAKQQEGFALITITNQGGIDRGYYTHDHVQKIHDQLDDHFKNHGVTFLDWFYCPHHDSVEFCLCRKPGTLMLEKAIAKHGISKEHACFIGDKDSDVAAAGNAGIKPIKIDSNEDLNMLGLDLT